jgi:parallel beta-helix repeat protein
LKTARLLLVPGLLAAGAAGLWTTQRLRAGAAQPPSERIIDASKYPNLQAAFDAVPEKGGIVRLPPGEFELKRPLLLSRGDTRIEGSGAATHLINRNQNGEPALAIRHEKLAGKAPAAAPSALRIWRVQLANFRISGNPKSGDGVLAHGVNEIFIDGVAADHHGGHGIRLIDCYEDPRISDSIFTYNGQAGLHILRSHDIVVNANQFEENQDAVQCLDSFNLCMNANNIDDHLRDGVVIENTYGSVLSGNMIEECQGTAVVLDRDCYGITVSANVIAHNFGGGVHLRDAWGSTISANTFTIVPNLAVRVGPQSGRIAITGNNFSNSFIGGRTIRPEDYKADPPRISYATGVALESTSDITITGNIFTGLTEEAVKTTGRCRRVVIAGNVAADLGRRAGAKLPAFHLPAADEVMLGNNSVEKGFEQNER